MECRKIKTAVSGTKDVCLTYPKNKTGTFLKLIKYSDAYWGTDCKETKSISGSMILYGENSILWFSKKQSCVKSSSAEEEYVAVATSDRGFKGFSTEK